MPVSLLPTVPSRADPANFAARADALLGALPQFVEEINVLQITTNAATAASQVAAAASAAAAAASRDQANAAWAASMAPAESLPAISKSIHTGAVVKLFLYDTSKDSDGGAWRKRCADKSWYTETLGFTGTWRNQLATTAAAWAVAGAAAGDGFQNTTDGKFYVLTGTSTASEIFRGNVREFPEQVAIILDGTGSAIRVTVYDLTQIGCPMWAVISRKMPCYTATALSSCFALNGKIWVGSNAGYGGLFSVDFVKGEVGHWGPGQGASATGIYAHTFTTSDSGKFDSITPSTFTRFTANSAYLVNVAVNDIAITVLEGAPVDPATGLPVPTIAIACLAGISVIKSDGTVASITITNNNIGTIIFSGYFVLFDLMNNGGRYVAAYDTRPLTTHTIGTIDTVDAQRSWLVSSVSTSVPAYKPNIGSSQPKLVRTPTAIASGDVSTLSYLKDSPSLMAKSMMAYLTNAYTSGWMVGDIKGAWLADTAVETITAASELVTNGTFATDTSGWSAWTSSAVLSVDTARLKVTNGAAVNGYATQAITTVAGKTYSVSAGFDRGSSTLTANLWVGNTAGASALGNQQISATQTGTLAFNFTATATTTYVTVLIDSVNAAFGYFDNISCKLVEADRSVKNTGLIVNGSLTKAVVASGAGLVSYSGFSTSNYLEQPSNANLDFGTGDFCVMGWVMPTAAGTYALMSRKVTAVTNETLLLLTAGVPSFRVATSAGALTASQPVITGAPNFLVFFRFAGTLYAYVNGVAAGSITNTETMTRAAALTFGERLGDTLPFTAGSLALWRISATAPSADQIAYIYKTELPLFQPDAQCTIDGTSSAVTALAYDDTTELLKVGTSWGRSTFKGLLRTGSSVSTVGAITSLAVSQGTILVGGATSCYQYQPAMLLRDELRRKEEARKALGKVPVFFDFDTISFTSPTTSGSAALTASSIVGTPYVGMGITGTGIPVGTTIISISGTAYTMSANATVTNAGAVALGQSSFTLPQGYTTKAVYSVGTLKRVGSTKDYTIATDGFRETVNFGTSPGSAVWVSIMCVRSN